MQKVDLSSAGSVAAQIFDISKCWPSDCISISSLLFLRLNFAIPNLYSEVLHQSSFFVLTFASYESICKLYATFSKQKPLCLGDFAVKSFSSIHTMSTNLARQFFSKAKPCMQQVDFDCLPSLALKKVGTHILCLPCSDPKYESDKARRARYNLNHSELECKIWLGKYSLGYITEI